MPDQHPIDSKEWHAAYGKPRHAEQHLRSVTVEELGSIQSQQMAGKEYLVIDVRRADCTVGVS